MDYQYASNRIFASDDSGKCIAEVLFPEISENVYDITHTFVDDSLRGQGVAAELVKRAVEDIRKRGGNIRTSCSYAAAWCQRHGV